MPVVITRGLDHIADPAGTITVSPGLALASAVLTSANDVLAAIIGRTLLRLLAWHETASK
jgi:hypothetical protein